MALPMNIAGWGELPWERHPSYWLLARHVEAGSYLAGSFRPATSHPIPERNCLVVNHLHERLCYALQITSAMVVGLSCLITLEDHVLWRIDWVAVATVLVLKPNTVLLVWIILIAIHWPRVGDLAQQLDKTIAFRGSLMRVYLSSRWNQSVRIETYWEPWRVYRLISRRDACVA